MSVNKKAEEGRVCKIEMKKEEGIERGVRIGGEKALHNASRDR